MYLKCFFPSENEIVTLFLRQLRPYEWQPDLSLVHTRNFVDEFVFLTDATSALAHESIGVAFQK